MKHWQLELERLLIVSKLTCSLLTSYKFQQAACRLSRFSAMQKLGRANFVLQKFSSLKSSRERLF